MAPIVGFPSVQDIGIRLAGVRIDWQPDGEPAALFDSVSVSVTASVLRCSAASFEYFRARALTLAEISRRPRIVATTWHLSKGARWLQAPEHIRLFVYVSVKHVIARVLRLSSGVDNELAVIP